MDDEALSNFAAITGTAPNVARHYLQLTDGNLEQAIQLFFDSPELASMAETQSSAPSRPPRPAARSSGRTDDAGVIHLDSDDEMDQDDFDDNVPAPSNVNDDEAMARRLQEEMYAGGGARGAGGGFEDEEVRAPIARTTETLVGPDASWGDNSNDAHDQLLEQLRRRTQGRSARPGVFSQSGPSIWDESSSNVVQQGAFAQPAVADTTSKAARLAELFRPPFDLMCRLSWDDARDQGKEEEKWLLVNIQDPAIFDCQTLNRDIWKHEGIKETVQSNFLFMQYSKDDPKGNQYMQYYFQHRDNDALYPHIAIVDPRTGEQVKLWSGPPVPKAMDFLMQLHEFLDRYSLDASAKNPVAKRKASKPAAMDVGKLSEEQQMELALKASMADGAVSDTRIDDPDDLTKSFVDSTSKGKAKEEEVVSPEPEEASTFSRISSSNPHTEPEGGPAEVTRIQFRHSGGRVIHKFALNEPVQRIYEWLKAAPIEGKAGIEFELKAVGGKNLIDALDTTIVDAQLKNATVMVEYIED